MDSVYSFVYVCPNQTYHSLSQYSSYLFYWWSNNTNNLYVSLFLINNTVYGYGLQDLDPGVVLS